MKSPETGLAQDMLDPRAQMISSGLLYQLVLLLCWLLRQSLDTTNLYFLRIKSSGWENLSPWFQQTSQVCFPLHIPEAVPLVARDYADWLRPVCGLLFSIIILMICPQRQPDSKPLGDIVLWPKSDLILRNSNQKTIFQNSKGCFSFHFINCNYFWGKFLEDLAHIWTIEWIKPRPFLGQSSQWAVQLLHKCPKDFTSAKKVSIVWEGSTKE